MSEENKNENVEQPKAEVHPLIKELEKLQPPKRVSGMKALSKLQEKYINELLEYNQKRTTILTLLQSQQDLERTQYIIPRNAEAVREFINFITPVLEQLEASKKEETDGQKEASGSADSTSKE